MVTARKVLDVPDLEMEEFIQRLVPEEISYQSIAELYKIGNFATGQRWLALEALTAIYLSTALDSEMKEDMPDFIIPGWIVYEIVYGYREAIGISPADIRKALPDDSPHRIAEVTKESSKTNLLDKSFHIGNAHLHWKKRARQAVALAVWYWRERGGATSDLDACRRVAEKAGWDLDRVRRIWQDHGSEVSEQAARLTGLKQDVLGEDQ